MNNKRVFIGSLATVVAAGAIGINISYAQTVKNNSTKRDAYGSIIRDVQKDDFHLHDDHDRHSEKLAEVIMHAHQLREKGKVDAARHALEKAGIEDPQNIHEHKNRYQNSKKALFQSALEGADWELFCSTAEGRRIATKLNTREKFDLFIEARDLRVQGRYQEAREIMRDLDLRSL